MLSLMVNFFLHNRRELDEALVGASSLSSQGLSRKGSP